jgi:hypothetical protein
MKEIIIDGITYVPQKQLELEKDYVLVRTYSAGVHIGTLKERNGTEVKLTNARRIWKWAGAFTLSELATKGPSQPSECKISCVLESIILTQAIEIIAVTGVAKNIIEGLTAWEA